ncbi:MAG: PRC-barrel domain-containing protein [Terriglobales bacterium]
MSEYPFAERADDIRGAALYGSDEEKIGNIQDVIFDHQSGDIRYLIADSGKRRVAVPADRVFRAPADEDSFIIL